MGTDGRSASPHSAHTSTQRDPRPLRSGVSCVHSHAAQHGPITPHEGSAYGVSRAVVSLGPQLGIGVQGQRCRRVPHALLHDFDVQARTDQVRRVDVPQVVESKVSRDAPILGQLPRRILGSPHFVACNPEAALDHADKARAGLADVLRWLEADDDVTTGRAILDESNAVPLHTRQALYEGSDFDRSYTLFNIEHAEDFAVTSYTKQLVGTIKPDDEFAEVHLKTKRLPR